MQHFNFYNVKKVEPVFVVFSVMRWCRSTQRRYTECMYLYLKVLISYLLLFAITLFRQCLYVRHIPCEESLVLKYIWTLLWISFDGCVGHQWGTGISGLMRGMATLPQGNQELLVIRDKVGRPPDELVVCKSMECDIFPFSALTLLVGQ